VFKKPPWLLGRWLGVWYWLASISVKFCVLVGIGDFGENCCGKQCLLYDAIPCPLALCQAEVCTFCG